MPHIASFNLYKVHLSDEESLRYMKLEKAIYEDALLKLETVKEDGEDKENASPSQIELNENTQPSMGNVPKGHTNPPSLKIDSDEKRAEAFQTLAKMLYENHQEGTAKDYALRVCESHTHYSFHLLMTSI